MPAKSSYINKAFTAAAYGIATYVLFLFSIAHNYLAKYTSLRFSKAELETYVYSSGSLEVGQDAIKKA